MTSKVYSLGKRRRHTGNWMTASAFHSEGRHSLRQKCMQTLSPRHVAKAEGDHGSEADPAPREHRTSMLRWCPDSSSRCSAVCYWPRAPLRPGLLQTLFTMAEILHQGYFHAVLCFFFNISVNSSPRGVTMRGAVFIIHSNALGLKSTWKLFFPQGTLCKNTLV